MSGNCPDTAPSGSWFRKEDDFIECLLCPHHCRIVDGQSGKCGVRSVRDGTFKLDAWGYITACSSDPIEKKPLYHFHPGEQVWSVGFNGCNLACPFCQNDSISRPGLKRGRLMKPQDVIDDALVNKSRMLAYTYSEPTIHYEYLMECSVLADKAGLKNILVTNGQLLGKPAEELLGNMDGVNVDLKSWSADYYRETLGGNLDTVLKFIEIAQSKCWLEITTLIVPGDNDIPGEMENMSRWIANLSPDIPLHLSAYHPASSYKRPPTDRATMLAMAEIANQHLNFVYVGNIGMENNTICSFCSAELIQRRYYRTESRIVNGTCPDCHKVIPGVFPE